MKKLSNLYLFDLLYSISLFFYYRIPYDPDYTKADQLERVIHFVSTATSDKRKKRIPYHLAMAALNWRLEKAIDITQDKPF